MAQMELDCVSTPESVEFKICLEDLREEEALKLKKEVEQKSVSNRLLKLYKKAELNARYFEELRPVELIGRQVYFSKYEVF